MSVPPGAATFGRLLREHRLAAELTQEALAERSRVSIRTIQELEAGSVRPRRATVTSLADALVLSDPAREELERAATPTPRRRTSRPPEPPAGDRARRDERSNLAVARPHPT